MSSTPNSLSRAIERRLALPVMVCALFSVPAIFLELWGEGTWAWIGNRVNWLAGLVLWAEWILLIALAENKREWLRANRWSTFVAALTVPAVIFALGPAQVLRLTRVAGTLRLVRVSRIIEAGGVLRRRMGVQGFGGKVTLGATFALSGVFALTILADPDSATRRYLADLPGTFSPWQLLLTLFLITTSAALILYLRRRRTAPKNPDHEDGPETENGSGAESPDHSP